MNVFGGGSGPAPEPGAGGESGVRAIHIDELPALEQTAGAVWRPIRRALDLTGVAVNAYTGVEVGDEVIELHDERAPSAAGTRSSISSHRDGRRSSWTASQSMLPPER